MFLYHYTNDRNLKRILEGTSDCSHKDQRTGKRVTGVDARGLWPHKRFLSLGAADGMPDEAFDAWTFAFLERVSKTHAANPEFPNLWTHFLDYFISSCHRDDATAIVLLRFEAQPDDGAFVIDKAPIERLLYKLDGRPLEREHRRAKSLAYQQVWATKTPLDEYKGGFSVPEVIIKHPIMPERLEEVTRMTVARQEY